MASVRNGFLDIFSELKESIKLGKESTKQLIAEVKEEVLDPPKLWLKAANENRIAALEGWLSYAKTFIHIPYFPPFHRPGWLVAKILGPYDADWVESFIYDICAGITVGLTLIPQGLSYATLANLQPVHGLYAAILPSAVYVFFGSSLQLAVGPVAVVSLLTGQVVENFVPNYNEASYYNDAGYIAAEVALAVGATLTVLSVFNLGNFIRYISFPVMSGFISGAACVIGLNQLKSAFGFSYSGVPQQGQTGFEYNYQVMHWFRVHWWDRYHYTASQLKTPKSGSSASAILKWKKNVLYNGQLYRNKYATRICFGIAVPLIIIQILKSAFIDTPERKKKLSYRLWILFASIAPFISIIIAAHEAWRIYRDDNYVDPNFNYSHQYDAHTLKIVGNVPSGLSFLKSPTLKWPFVEVLKQSIPVALVAYMESYAVSRRIAAQRGELHILNASQELWANGAANLLASVSSAYPVCGSFSRSSLNAATGARTPISKVITMLVVIVALQTLTGTFYYIPQAALAAVIFAAIYNLVSFSDLWHAWKQNKRDFFTMLFAWIMVLTFNTEVGLAASISLSFGWVLFDIAFSDHNKPVLVKAAAENDGIDEVRLLQDLTFISAGKVKDFLLALSNVAEKPVSADASFNQRILYKITSTLDKLLTVQQPKYVDVRPKAIIVDLAFVRTIDLTALQGIEEIQKESRLHNVAVVLINASSHVEGHINKFGLKNDASNHLVNLDKYLDLAGSIGSFKFIKNVYEVPSASDEVPRASDEDLQKHNGAIQLISVSLAVPNSDEYQKVQPENDDV